MDIELTGNETPEELEALIDGLGDVDISDVTPMAAVTTPPVAVVVDNITEETHAVVNTGDKKPEKAQITPEQINAIRDDFPGMAAMQVTATPLAVIPTNSDVQRIAAEKLAAATTATQVPGSPSDLGVTTTHTASPLEQAANASPDQLQAMFAGMTDAQIEALLDQAI